MSEQVYRVSDEYVCVFWGVCVCVCVCTRTEPQLKLPKGKIVILLPPNPQASPLSESNIFSIFTPPLK